MATFISVPLKKTSEVDLAKPLVKFIQQTCPSGGEEQAQHCRAAEELSKLRRAALGRPLDKHEGALETLLRWAPGAVRRLRRVVRRRPVSLPAPTRTARPPPPSPGLPSVPGPLLRLRSDPPRRPRASSLSPGLSSGLPSGPPRRPRASPPSPGLLRLLASPPALPACPGPPLRASPPFPSCPALPALTSTAPPGLAVRRCGPRSFRVSGAAPLAAPEGQGVPESRRIGAPGRGGRLGAGPSCHVHPARISFFWGEAFRDSPFLRFCITAL